MSDNPFLGKWSYRSFLNDPNLVIPSDGSDPNIQSLLFGYGTLVIAAAAPELLVGTIGGGGWSLTLHGSRAYGSPAQVRFQGKGIVGGAEWIYDYHWMAGSRLAEQQPEFGVPAIVGSVTRTIPHPSGADGKAIAPAGVVASFYAVRQN